MTDLLAPRYEVIADYPGNNKQIGDVFEGIGTTDFYFRKFPSIFRKLQWYEKRDKSLFPKYLKGTDHTGVIFPLSQDCVWEDDDKDIAPAYYVGGQHIGCFTPATESDYTAYKLKQQL